MKRILIALFTLSVLIFILLAYGWVLFGPAGTSKEIEVFIVPQEKDGLDVTESLYDQSFIKNEKGFRFLLDKFARDKEIKPGGYRFSKNMYAWQVLGKITGRVDLAWVTISFCPRKEQVGEKLASALGWSQDELDKWNNVYTNTKPEYFEGVYYPDTYLLPVDEHGGQIAARFINHFNEKFTPFIDKFIAKNIKWTTGLKIASLIAREAGGVEDMKLISGIIWNRLDQGMALQIDATMQYTLGKNEDGSWWGDIDLAEKQKDSPYNSYLYKGLSPTPICSPNVDAIEAALNPEETDCLFYLHDNAKNIHCAVTYEEHLENIKKYL
ncbi:hypothetical protein A3A76_05985 [Candidatus Woesebacteria bacterium RIFCSPLOWO2_01_FULL_39_23]|uniref:Endolytic murein transglycosylase n=1 Tax=Candidatus Woesebacteria bacterium RIFCSPHIGHO2_01_FULL_40_22 TaxID=1802499 RepID=A0A1F7YI52_9BACT|nr:MAG: hypothetical protein A2141_02685 [Candidatus Woesebacteria bacterium RBG_16_40_11]OGM26952.1 MAG: hypothetical protein A2628_05930 [Candidatus Woesebacteria bacterium RIFCSPHIGHO2_01_FULL_40_22]OGM37359.1 MAG: hypothetical protein A3E41_04335 [Candidatus Woesebacteria bacterium RIFCSPHIGHO2_12_FULL_38_9]OGM63226.1 MAG: hypothetical protein A3A76_05985 [Candidatus Woesebacteria bacterium RIFCSPLOWO2_01_FULL_39_23]